MKLEIWFYILKVFVLVKLLDNGKPYYTLHRPGLYSIEALQDQGALTVKEQTEAAQGVSVIDKALQSLGNTANLVLLGVGAAAVYAISKT